ncbi:MAG TPA: DUF2339 domain-containing protein [Solirubrobacteraceae bacterium]|nr:DUF2339 domain-containing protein [Solirubrobacteraceae bacterium]
MASATDMERLDTLERTTQALAARLQRLELRAGPAIAPYVAPLAQESAPVPAPDSAPASSGPSLEDLFGGRVLAWAGGVAVLVGVVLLLAIAVTHGWIGEGARTVAAGTIALALIGAGTWLQERRRRSDAALATAAAGIAALFVTVAVGGPVYGVLPVAVAYGLALAAGALAAALAVRWEARGIGALGIVGALLAPVLAGAPSEGATLALLWLAGLSGVAVLIWQRWNWLAFAVFAVTLAQWLAWLADGPPPAAVLLVLTAFGALNAAAAVGFELRVPTTALRASSALLLTLNAIVLAFAGWGALEGSALAELWLALLAGAHLAVGLATRSTRIARDVRLLAFALGVLLADVAAGLVLHGPVLAATWAVATAGCALLARRAVARRGEDHDELLLGLGLGGHLLLGAAQAIAQAPPDALSSGGAVTLGAQLAIASVAAGAFVAGRFAGALRPDWRTALDAAAMAGVAYLTALTLDGTALVVALALQALALATITARSGDVVPAWGAGAFLALALGHALAFEAPPMALVAGLGSVPAAALALGAIALTALRGAQLLPRARTGLLAAAALTLLYLASAALVTPFAGDLGQALLSGLWATAGLTALVAGLLRDERTLRIGALALLGTTIAKVFLYDLAALESLYRVASFIALGLLLLLAAGLWQRMRPRPLPDLRAAPPALR